MNDHDPQQQTRKLGQGMVAAAFVLAIALLTWFFAGVEQRAHNPNEDPASTQTIAGGIEVQLERNRAGHYVMSGSINGVSVDFILDTGATDVVIPASVADAAGLEQGYANQAMTANGMVTIFSTRIASLELGAIELNDVRASINPSMHDSIVLLGMSALRQIEFSQRGSLLTLRYHPE
jgi:aspartyl protease family protein